MHTLYLKLLLNAGFILCAVTSLVAQAVKRRPTIQEAWVWSLGQEDPPEKEMATHHSILNWEIPWTEEPAGYIPSSCKKFRYDLPTKQ